VGGCEVLPGAFDSSVSEACGAIRSTGRNGAGDARDPADSLPRKPSSIASVSVRRRKPFGVDREGSWVRGIPNGSGREKPDESSPGGMSRAASIT
jgi:hypothetical protein